MTYFPRFAWPEILVLLLMIPWSLYVGAKIRSLSRLRKITALTLRTLILAALIGALAGTEIVKTSDRLAVFFLLDHSDSIPDDMRRASAQWVRNLGETAMKENDEAGVVVFGDNASVELSVAPKLDLDVIRSYVGGGQTDLAAALRLAMAAFPQGYMRRVVVLSDGNETAGTALEEAKVLQADGIAVDVLPITIGEGREVRVREVSAPGQSSAGEPFQLRVIVHSTEAVDAQLTVYQKSGEERRMLPPQQVRLQPGDNAFLLTQELYAPGFYEYEVAVETDGDTIAENNTGRAFTSVHGEPVVLYVDGTGEAGGFLDTALNEEGLVVRRVAPYDMPTSLGQLLAYDGVILSDVSSIDLTMEQLELIEAMVRDHGIGLVMIGGPNTFGAGGYLDTAVEKALPVSMDIKQRKILPRGALVTVLHTCEIQGGNAWAREIALAALNVLSSQDLMGVNGYLWEGGDGWIFPLQPVGDKTMMRQAIAKGSESVGDMPGMEPTLAMAYQALAAADAAVKRVVIITDGDPSPPNPSTVRKLAAANISVSTVCIAPHSSSDESMLNNIAQATGGQYYFVNDPQKLPLIFAKEAAVVKRGVLMEEEFTPVLHHDSELLFGLGETGLPPLLGYVVTTPKDSATVPIVSHKDDPVLAHWRYGLGKSVAFTSDVTNRWAAHWLGWEGFNRFWAQTVRWSLRELAPSNFQVQTRREGGMGRIRIDAVDEQGRFINFLKPKGVVTTPEYDSVEVDLEQTGPGIYEGAFPIRDSGVYMANITYSLPGKEGESAGMTPTGIAVDYSREYEYFTTNVPLLEQLAATGGGRVLETEDDPFQHDLVASATVTPIWHWLALFAACLFPFEIFVRRVVIPWNYVFGGVAWCMHWLPWIGRRIPLPDFRPSTATGRYTAAAREFTYDTDAPEASFGEVMTSAHSAPAPPSKTASEPQEAESSPAAGRTEYTRRLLAAKDRAGTARKGRPKQETNEENDS